MKFNKKFRITFIQNLNLINLKKDKIIPFWKKKMGLNTMLDTNTWHWLWHVTLTLVHDIVIVT